MATATLSATAVNKDCTFTNNAATDVVVLRRYSEASTPPKEIFQQTLTLFPTKDGQQVLKAGQAGAITLDETHTDAGGNTVDTTSYGFILATPDCLYPVKSASTVLRSSSSGKSYQPVTVAATDYAVMQSAESFLQTIMAYPSSSLAQDFATACNKAVTASTDDTTDYIGAFFRSTVGFQNVTQLAYTALTTYYSQFPYVWAGYQGGKTYYLYGSDGKNISYAGAFTIKVPVTIPANPDKSLPGFSFTFTDASNVTKKLYYQNGQFVDDSVAGVPGICLSCSFVLKGTLSKVATDTAIIPVLAGKVYGLSAIGFDEKQTIVKADDGTNQWSGTYALLHPKNAADWIALIVTGTAVMAGLKMVMGAIEYVQQRRAAKQSEHEDGSPLTDAEEKELQTEKGAYTDEMKKEYQATLDKLNQNLELPTDVNAAMKTYGDNLEDQLNRDMKTSVQDSLQEQSDFIEDVLEYGNPQSLQTVSDLVLANASTVDAAITPGDIAKALPGVKAGMGDVNTKLGAELTRVNEMVSAEQQKAFEQAKEGIDQREKTSDNIDDSLNDASNGKLPDNIQFEPSHFQPSVVE